MDLLSFLKQHKTNQINETVVCKASRHQAMKDSVIPERWEINGGSPTIATANCLWSFSGTITNMVKLRQSPVDNSTLRGRSESLRWKRWWGCAGKNINRRVARRGGTQESVGPIPSSQPRNHQLLSAWKLRGEVIVWILM